jgi:hypothetical protein
MNILSKGEKNIKSFVKFKIVVCILRGLITAQKNLLKPTQSLVLDRFDVFFLLLQYWLNPKENLLNLEPLSPQA